MRACATEPDSTRPHRREAPSPAGPLSPARPRRRASRRRSRPRIHPRCHRRERSRARWSVAAARLDDSPWSQSRSTRSASPGACGLRHSLSGSSRHSRTVRGMWSEPGTSSLGRRSNVDDPGVVLRSRPGRGRVQPFDPRASVREQVVERPARHRLEATPTPPGLDGSGRRDRELWRGSYAMERRSCSHGVFKTVDASLWPGSSARPRSGSRQDRGYSSAARSRASSAASGTARPARSTGRTPLRCLQREC